MKIASARVLDRLPAEEPCLGAFFSSYGFDPAFFEEHVLRAVLRLTSDPVEQAERYHHEARRALQETPVVAVVDAGERRPGRRLPFDLLQVSNVVFHPKTVLLLYRKHARLQVGSGNLTFPGYGGNTELFFCVDLAYDEAEDARLLLAFDEHLSRLGGLVRQGGTQLQLFRDELRRRLPSALEESPSASVTLLDSTVGPIIEQLAALLPADAEVQKIGMLAPFYERDDAGELDISSVFGALSPRAAADAELDVGVAWDNPQVHATPEVVSLEEGLDRLWAWAYEDDRGTRVLEHLVPFAVGPKAIRYFDEGGTRRRWPLPEVRDAIERRTLWLQPPPVAYAPQKAIAAAVKRFGEVRLWLHPATRLLEGRPIHRPLHAKLLVVAFRSGGDLGTLVLMGSPNMSRRALLMRAGTGLGNVEVALAFQLEGSITLRDLVPELVFAPVSAFELKEREFPEPGRNFCLAIEEAVHDPKAETLRVTWSAEADPMPPWRLSYDGQTLAQSESPPTEPLLVREFKLKPSTAEVVLHVDGGEYPAVILVTDLVALPATPHGVRATLDELLLLLGRRIGAERAAQLAARRAAESGEGTELTSMFGEGFGPTDVFRAWWSVAEELRDPSLSVAAFRLRLEGSLGLGAAWSCMLEAMAPDEDGQLSFVEVWFYGAELLRSLSEVELPLAEDREAKIALLQGFSSRVRQDLASVPFDPSSRTWTKRVAAFYEVSKS